MKLLLVLTALQFFASTLGVPPCDPELCKLPDCLCPSSNPPGNLSSIDIPQLVLLTFDDAVSIQNIDYYTQLFDNKKNPDGCPISTTYFVTHEYTDYSKVHELWGKGHEIALHSISHQTPTAHWQELSVDEHKNEFVDQIKLINKFAKIPEKDIRGIRLPFLQLSGNNSFEMIKESELKYDCSWPTQSYIDSGLFPYTLDYISPQDCPTGPCPNVSIPGVWVVPMVDWRDKNGAPCAMVDACITMPDEEKELVDLMKKNFHRHYNGSRSPFGFYVHAAWFARDQKHLNAYTEFLNYLLTLQDVYIVSIQKALDWVQNPKKLLDLDEDWACSGARSTSCKPQSCKLIKEGAEERYMTVCDSNCPNVYPWLGNPLGQ